MKKQILMISTIGMLMIACFAASPAIGSGYSSASSGNILYVGGVGPENYTKIQYAIGNASEGDTIFVYSGIYYENVYIYKAIQLTGENQNNTIINASGDSYCIYIESPGVTVEKFTLEESGSRGLWIADHSDWAMISDCIIKDNYYGISIENTRNVTIQNCAIIANSDGLRQENSDGSIINNCYFSSYFCSIYLYESKNNKISDCSVIGDLETIYSKNGIYLRNSCYNEICNCIITYTWDAIPLWQGSCYNIIRDCWIANNGEGVIIDSGSNFNHIYGNSFINNTENQAFDDLNSNNEWDNGYPSGGNHWSDYKGIDRYNGPDQNINGSDGIGDTPYNILGGNSADRYPLVPLDQEAPQVEIVKPISGLYMMDKLVRKYFLPRLPLIIGSITIGFNASDNDSGVYRVEIFIDNESRGNITSEPYNFTWTHERINLFKHKHTIKVVAFDYAGNSASDEITVRKFL